MESWEEVLVMWGYCGGSFSYLYLCMPLGASSNNTKVWEPLLERIRGRLELWKRRYLLKDSCLVLLKSTISSFYQFF